MAEYYDDPAVRYDAGLRYSDPVPPLERNEMSQVVTGLSGLNAAGVIQLGKNVHTALNGNVNVPTANPTLPALQTLITTAETKNDAYEAEKDVLRTKRNERDAAVEALADGLRTEAVTVQSATAGDPDKIETTGFRARRHGTPIGIPAQVQNLKVTAGEAEGTLGLSWAAMSGIDTFELESATDPAGAWTPKGTVKKCRTTVNSFTSGTRIYLRVRAVGAAGAGAWSDIASKTVP